MALRVLVVEDDDSLRTTLGMGLRTAGFDVVTAALGNEGMESADRLAPEVALVDVNLPDESGFALCARLKERGSQVILLTVRNAIEDRLHGFEVGADDYVTKPFVLGELVARIRAVARRHSAAGARQLRVGTLRVDLGAMRAERDGHALDLTRREMDLLVYFVRNAGRVLARDQILNHVWGYDSDVGDGVIDVYVSYLRRKLEAFGPRMLETVWGLGYRLNDDAP